MPREVAFPAALRAESGAVWVLWLTRLQHPDRIKREGKQNVAGGVSRTLAPRTR